MTYQAKLIKNTVQLEAWGQSEVAHCASQHIAPTPSFKAETPWDIACKCRSCVERQTHIQETGRWSL